MLRACVEFTSSWNEHLPLMKFAYNNSYHSSIGIAPYEALYDKKCKTSVCWDKERKRKLLDLEIVQITADQIRLIRKKLKTTQDRQKSYADPKYRDVIFSVGNQIFLKVSS